MQSEETVLASYGPTKTAILTMLLRRRTRGRRANHRATRRLRARLLGVESVQIGDFARLQRGHQSR